MTQLKDLERVITTCKKRGLSAEREKKLRGALFRLDEVTTKNERKKIANQLNNFLKKGGTLHQVHSIVWSGTEAAKTGLQPIQHVRILTNLTQKGALKGANQIESTGNALRALEATSRAIHADEPKLARKIMKKKEEKLAKINKHHKIKKILESDEKEFKQLGFNYEKNMDGFIANFMHLCKEKGVFKKPHEQQIAIVNLQLLNANTNKKTRETVTNYLHQHVNTNQIKTAGQLNSLLELGVTNFNKITPSETIARTLNPENIKEKKMLKQVKDSHGNKINYY
ncbi:MAG: hypothetical protein ABH803_01670 [Candidatus Micrarchaeota archaeon]